MTLLKLLVISAIILFISSYVNAAVMCSNAYTTDSVTGLVLDK